MKIWAHSVASYPISSALAWTRFSFSPSLFFSPLPTGSDKTYYRVSRDSLSLLDMGRIVIVAKGHRQESGSESEVDPDGCRSIVRGRPSRSGCIASEHRKERHGVDSSCRATHAGLSYPWQIGGREPAAVAASTELIGRQVSSQERLYRSIRFRASDTGQSTLSRSRCVYGGDGEN